MCGILGSISTEDLNKEFDKALLSLSHRGPDKMGTYSFAFHGKNGIFGHTRLKVIDLDDRSSQPFISKSGNTVTIYNGEIYNFTELKNLLPQFKWRTSSDTEVITELIEAYGDEVIERFNGIFAIAYLDLKRTKLKILRDKFGVKPLYFSISKNNDIFFASEIKALKQMKVDLSISEDDIFESLNFGYVHEPNTGFKNIKKVMPGEIYTFSYNSFSKKKYNYIPHATAKYDNKILEKAIKDQTISDVPIGTFYSGGLDSSVIAASTNSDLLYIDQDSSLHHKEKNKALEFSNKLERKIFVSKALEKNKSLIQIADDVAMGIEEPICDMTFLNSKELSRIAKEKNFTVMLSGMGADEIFGGYLRHYVLKHKFLASIIFKIYILFFKHLKLISPHKKERIKNFLNEDKIVWKYARLVGYFSTEELEDLVGRSNYNKFSSDLEKRLNNLIPGGEIFSLLSIRELENLGFLSHNLTVADKSSMASSIELRVPFIDLNLVHAWMDHPNHEKLLGKKPLLRYINKFHKFSWSPLYKTGFNPSIEEMFLNIKEKEFLEIICTKEMYAFFKKHSLHQIINNCFKDANVNYHKLWQLVFLSRWLKHWNN